MNLQNRQASDFSQTFLLASEAGSQNAYYVNNDMVCYTPGPIPPPAQAPPAAAAPTGAAAPTPPSPKKEESPKFGTVPEPTEGPVADEIELGKAAIPASAQPAPAKDKPATSEEPVAAPEAASVAEDAAPSGPVSWASMAAKNKNKPVNKPPQDPKRKSAEARKSVDEKPDGGDETEVASNGKDGAPTGPPPTKQGREKRAPRDMAAELDSSIFVSGVPGGCDEDKIKELFGKHGEVTKVILNAEKHFAIIEYSSTPCAVEALKTAAVSLLLAGRSSESFPAPPGHHSGHP